MRERQKIIEILEALGIRDSSHFIDLPMSKILPTINHISRCAAVGREIEKLIESQIPTKYCD